MSDPEDDDRTPGGAPAPDPAFERLLEKLSAEYNFDFRQYKAASLSRRVRKRMQQVRVDSFDAYIAYLERHPDEHVALFNTILINVTGFFRDPEAWKAIGSEILPRLVADAAESRALRVWSAGCSSGEEAYSAAILIAEHLGDRSREFNVKIYATDVDEEALHTARLGLYRLDDVKELPASLLEKYFNREGQTYRFRRDLRRWCIFGRHNVAQDPPLSHIDLLICRNVLIYFTSALQERILARFHYAVREGGFLFLGRSESLLARSLWFAPHQAKWRIFERTTAPPPTVALAMMRAGQETPAGDIGPRDAPAPPSLVVRVLDVLPSAVFVVDLMDTVFAWNGAAAALFDIPIENAVGRKFRDLDISYRVEGMRSRIEQVKTAHIPVRMEDVTFYRRSGEIVHVELSVVPVLEANRVVAVAVHGADATDAARLKDQMTRVAEQHATAIEELQSTNEELETTNEELQSTNEELETTNEELQSTNEELETTVEELQAVNTELGTLNAELEHRSAELKRLDDYQRAVLSVFQQAIVVVDLDGEVKTWNETAERLWGNRSEQVIGRPFWSLPIAKATPRVGEALARVIETGVGETVSDVPFTLATGETRTCALRISALRGASDEPIGVVAVASVNERQ
jgi:two-component system CheB/CheR fusion protein